MANNELTLVEQLDKEQEDHRRTVMLVVSGSLFTVAVISGVIHAIIDPTLLIMGVIVTACSAQLSSFVLAWFRYVDASGYVFGVGCSLAIGVSVLYIPEGNPDALTLNTGDAALYLGMLWSVFASIVLGRRGLLLLLSINLAFTALAIGIRWPLLEDPGQMASTGLTAGLINMVTAAALWLGISRNEAVASAMRRRLEEIGLVTRSARKIAAGDLTGELEGEDEVAEVTRQMLLGLRNLVAQIKDSAMRTTAATSELTAMATQQNSGANRQSAAIEETRNSLDGLLEGSRQISESAGTVLENAERALATNQQVAENIKAFSRHAERISSLLDSIREIAIKSETLALNASLEGIRAGEAGKGFSLVASQMQALTENVMESVDSVRHLTEDIRNSTEETSQSMERATELSTQTNKAAREIHVISVEQRNSNEQLSESMAEIIAVTRDVSASSAQLTEAAVELGNLAGQMDRLVARFAL